ncbi:MAG: ABC transporter permease [Ignavibacteriales bacterium]|nr:MAG: ABC transporter permease [Ignavibacteriales bacterium]
MINNFLKIILRNLIKHKTYSAINIIGLAVGITCFIALLLFVLDEMNYDRFNEKADYIYRVYISSDINGNASNTSKTAFPLGETLKNEYPEVASYTRIAYFGQHNFRYKEKLFRQGDVYAVDSTYFEIFTLPFLIGNPKTALVQPNSIVITERAAKKYFANENPVGKQFIIDDTITYNITGVMKDFPRKSHFSCNYLVSMSTYPESRSYNWINAEVTTYILFNRKINQQEFEKKLERLVNEKVGPQAAAIMGINLKEFLTNGNRYGYFLQPLTSIYLYSQSRYNIELNTEWGDVRNSNIYYSYIFLAIGVFILLIAIFNFMNLATAKSEGRAKEVGIRKTLGSDRSKLIRQFITESTFTCLLSVIAAYIILQFILPLFNEFVGRELSLELFTNLYTIPLLILFTLVIGLIAGSYPAFYLSSFQPSHILKTKTAGSKSGLRSSLVIIQFAISITLIIGTLIVKSQLQYILNKDLGFKKDRLIVINNASSLGSRVETFRQIISGNPNVLSSTNSSLMFQTGIPGSTFRIEGAPESEFKASQFLDVDYDFAKTYQVQILSGRFFSKEYSTDTNTVVLNETAAKLFNLDNPVGKTIFNVNTNTRGSIPYRIIGVVKDFNYESLHQNIRPLIFHIGPVKQATSILTIRIRTENYSGAISSIRETWEDFLGGKNFFCTVLNENLANMYEDEIRIETVTTVFSSLAIFIACLGLFGLAAFVTEKRIKEIGIRKVLGASIFEIVILLSKEFTKWVLLANIIAWPVAYLVMNNWLQDFSYRIELSWTIFIISALLALIIALTTVSYQAIKAAMANPVESLKYE